MRAEIPILVRRAEQSLGAAARLLEDSYLAASVSQAYYAMFYMASAVLLTRGMRFKRHATVIASFSNEFVKNHLLPAQLQQYLAAGFEERLRGDYSLSDEVSREEAAEQLRRAREFVAAVRELLEKESQA